MAESQSLRVAKLQIGVIMNLFSTLVDARQQLLNVLQDIEEAENSFEWYNAATNDDFRNSLTQIKNEFQKSAMNYGVYVVTRHCDCPNDDHQNFPTTNNFELDLPYPYDCKDFTFRHGQIFQGERMCVCPCDEKKEYSRHNVIDDVLYKKDSDIELCEFIERVLCDLSDAVESCGYKKSRSRVKERLLEIVLYINDQILPQSVDDYIAHVQKLSKSGSE